MSQIVKYLIKYKLNNNTGCQVSEIEGEFAEMK